jgi:DNA mismatch repair ATPase MutS
VTVADRDEAGARILGELRDRAVAEVASSAVDAVEALLDLFDLLRTEVAWYLGCIRLHDRLVELDLPVTIPEGVGPSELALGFEGLYDVGLALHLGKAVVGNDLDADGAELVVVTGANQGGKSTFLRSVGLAMSMLRAGTFVGARRLRASVPTAILTHYRREEEAGLELGKLDEELARMATVADAATPGALLVSNESFAATNEREGSEIAEGVVSALGDSGVRVVMVTHLAELARRLHQRGRPSTVTLRAERLSDGQRTFRLVEAAPEATSYGADLWERIFGAEGLDSNREPTGTGDRDVTTDTTDTDTTDTDTTGTDTTGTDTGRTATRGTGLR